MKYLFLGKIFIILKAEDIKCFEVDEDAFYFYIDGEVFNYESSLSIYVKYDIIKKLIELIKNPMVVNIDFEKVIEEFKEK
jgi:cell division GTPase FtsZ